MEISDFIIDAMPKDMLGFVRNMNERGYIVVMTVKGPVIIPKNEFINQDVNGILYDLNRDEATTISLAKDGLPTERMINDYAVAKTIRALKEKLEKYEKRYGREI